MTPHDLAPMLQAWQQYLTCRPWHELVAGSEPKPTGCGTLYELGNPVGRPDEDAAIADMRGLPHTEPHWHPAPFCEAYLGLTGHGVVYIAEQPHPIAPGKWVVIPSDTAHVTIPDQNLVLASVNSPAFTPESYISLSASAPEVCWDERWFSELLTERPSR